MWGGREEVLLCQEMLQLARAGGMTVMLIGWWDLDKVHGAI